MIAHLERYVADLPRSFAFFARALGPLGYAPLVAGPPAGLGAAPRPARAAPWGSAGRPP